MFLTQERKEEIKKSIMSNFDKVMVCDIQDILAQLISEVRSNSKASLNNIKAWDSNDGKLIVHEEFEKNTLWNY